MTGVLRLLALGAPLGLAACGPVTYLSRVTFGATGEVARARAGNCEQMAPYEYTLAAEYLRKAQLLASYARFQDANQFAQRSLDMAAKAREVTGERERKDELPIFVPDGTMYITPRGAVRKGKPSDVGSGDNEKPPLDVDSEKPPLGDVRKGGAK